jgi:hypothetical protein
MKACAIALLVLPSLLAAQERAALSGPITLEIRSTDTLRVASVAINFEGRLFGSLGVLRPSPGQIHCGAMGCVATTPAILELTVAPGKGRISVPDGAPELEVTVKAPDGVARHLVAYGHTLSFAREAGGTLTVHASRMTTRF